MCFGKSEKEKINSSPSTTSNTALVRHSSSNMSAVSQELNLRKKILLLGAGDSGKSTIFKQLQRIYGDGFSVDERRGKRTVIFENVLKNMMALIKATHTFNIPIENEDNRERAAKIDQLSSRVLLAVERIWSPELGLDIKSLWNDPGVKKTFKKRSEFQIEDSAQYYFDNLDRIIAEDYIPTEEDIVRARTKTTGLIEQKFTTQGCEFQLIDVGGQRNERKKWIHHFEGVDVVLFITSMSEFDQKCYEDESTNRMKESLQLFEDHINSKWFTNALVFLLFNKYDLFEKKIKDGSHLRDTFENYTGEDGDVDGAREYIVNQYASKDTCRKLEGISCITALNMDELRQNIEKIASSILKRNK
ncbi:hypothetical protein ABK040_012032 [Willaertia magna]